MCGVFGLYEVGENQSYHIYNALELLQHRGQDSAGICIYNENTDEFKYSKDKGLVSEVFDLPSLNKIKGKFGIGHVRYKTSGLNSLNEVQPFLVRDKPATALAHNGNLANYNELLEFLESKNIEIISESDTEIIIKILRFFLLEYQNLYSKEEILEKSILKVFEMCRGAYSIVALIEGYGLIAFRDILGIRPLLFGTKMVDDEMCYAFSSEKASLDLLKFKLSRDVKPGELMLINLKGELYSKQLTQYSRNVPCLFEFIYLSRPDSIFEKALIYNVRKEMGYSLAQKIKKEIQLSEIDLVVPVPETSCIIAQEISRIIVKEYAEVLVKNRYIGRTFIADGQENRIDKVTKKFNLIDSLIQGKNLLVVDDSIVRGTTSKKIIKMFKDRGANKVFFVSASPPVKYKNIYGLDIESNELLIAHQYKNINDIKEYLGCDALIYEDLESIKASINRVNDELEDFETSIFDGNYITENSEAAITQQLTLNF